ncbi:hypothetical protein GCM10009006_26770 [Haloarcula argentinensis]|uniref:Peptidase M48 domain-containing protein n=1 Tax=Haloarcula argentinensis TaxID=43776 RepID=A0A830FVM4_HALAR|nr:hypothetical protein GCM10009006_26770 [Haloarcula argentinensis]
MRKSLFIFGIAILCVVSVASSVGAAQAQQTSEVDTIRIEINPESTDTVTLFFRVAETDDPKVRASELAADADIPVYDISVTKQRATVTQFANGQVVSGGDLYRTSIATSVGSRTGLLGGQIEGESLARIAPTDSPTFVVVVTDGMSVTPGEPRSLFGEQYELTTAEMSVGTINYGFSGMTLAALGTVLCGSFGGAYGLIRVLTHPRERGDARLVDWAHVIRKTMTEGRLFAPIVPAAAGFLLGAVPLVSYVASEVFPALPASPWVTVTLWFVALTPFVCATWLGSALAAKRSYYELIAIEYDVRSVLAECGRSTVFSVFWHWAAAVVMLTFASQITRQPVVGAVLVTLLLIFRQTIALLVRRSVIDGEPLSDELRDDITDFAAQQGVSLRSIRRLETGIEPRANAFATNLPRYHGICLTADLIDELPRSELRAVVAHELGHIDNHHHLKQYLFTLGYWYIVFTLHTHVFPNALVIAVGTVAYLQFAAGWVSQRHEYEADEYAATVTSEEAVVGALDRIVSVNNVPKDVTMGHNLTTTHPSFDDRTEKLLGEQSPSQVPDADQRDS